MPHEPESAHDHSDRLPAQDLEALGNRITELAAHINAATYRFLRLIAMFDRYSGWGGDGLKSCAHWLNWKCGIGIGAAREKVRVARALGDLPLIAGAFEKGQVSYSKVRAMTRVATVDSEEFLLMIARHGTASHMERLVSGYQKVRRLESVTEQRTQRKLHWHVDDDGSVVLNGRLPADVGTLVITALESALSAREASGADTVKHVSAETSPGDDQPEQTFAARRADALGQLAESYLQHGDFELKGGDRHLLQVHISGEVLCNTPNDAFNPRHQPTLNHSAPASRETARRLACDCSLLPIFESARGEPMSVGRKTRVVPTALRRALTLRDQGCVFPGCTQQHYVDAHHVEHWADGGHTSLDNLVLLCRHHHTLVHDGGFAVRRLNEQFVFYTPAGATLPMTGERRFRGNVTELKSRHRREGLLIHARTAECKWTGEVMDMDLAVPALLTFDPRRDRLLKLPKAVE